MSKNKKWEAYHYAGLLLIVSGVVMGFWGVPSWGWVIFGGVLLVGA